MTNKAIQKLTGRDAIDAKQLRPELVLCKNTDPIEEARTGLTIDEANDVIAEDPSLIWTAVPEEISFEWTSRSTEINTHLSETRCGRGRVITRLGPTPAFEASTGAAWRNFDSLDDARSWCEADIRGRVARKAAKWADKYR